MEIIFAIRNYSGTILQERRALLGTPVYTYFYLLLSVATTILKSRPRDCQVLPDVHVRKEKPMCDPRSSRRVSEMTA